MTSIRLPLSALGAMAALALCAPAGAQSGAWPSPADLAKAFKAICLDNAGDHKAQAKAAQAAPWNMKRGNSTDETTYYEGMPWQVALGSAKGDLKVCAVTTGMASSTSDAQVRTATIEVLSPRPADLEDFDSGFYWEPTIGGKNYMIMYQGQAYGDGDQKMLIASYGLSWR